MPGILHQLNVDNSWTLFLDRDGVINKHLPNDYVKTIEEFVFNDDALEALARFTQVFSRIIIVTNQQGVGKRLMTEEDLKQIHQYMLHHIESNGGRIDAVLAATEKVELDFEKMRKPNTGMALRAQQMFPEIDFKKSIMVGDSLSDMQFGRNAGMKTVFVTHQKDRPTPISDIDFTISSLAELD